MWKDSYKIPNYTKTIQGKKYTVVQRTIEVTKKDAEERAKYHRKNGWKIRIVKFAYQEKQYGYVLYGRR